MDPRYKKMIKNTQKHLTLSGAKPIGKNDSFTFSCHHCGKCCMNREDILLNPKDLFRIARYYETMPECILQMYGEVYIGQSSYLPVVRAKADGNCCPFLKNHQCEIQEVRPSLCAIFPLGRYVTYSTEKPIKQKEVGYLIQTSNCEGQYSKEKHIVKEWIEENHVELNDPFFLKWSECLMELMTQVEKMKASLKPSQMNIVWSIILDKLYLDYDIKKSFMTQFLDNWDRLQLFLSIVKQKEFFV